MQTVQLKIKHMTLCDEARRIRREERKALRSGRWHNARQSDSVPSYALYENLRDHRIGTVRFHARVCHLTRAYMAGKGYKEVENGCKGTLKEQRAVAACVAKECNTFGYVTTEKSVEAWMGL